MICSREMMLSVVIGSATGEHAGICARPRMCPHRRAPTSRSWDAGSLTLTTPLTRARRMGAALTAIDATPANIALSGANGGSAE